MKELEETSWKAAQKWLVEGLGKSRVTAMDDKIILRFNLEDAKQFDQFNKFGLMAAEENIVFSMPKAKKHSSTDILSSNSMETEIRIPRTNSIGLEKIAYRMAVRTETRPNGEIHRPITAADSEYTLENLTGVPWHRVKGSSYDSDVVEAILPQTPDETLRAKQEYSLGYTLCPDYNTHVEVKDWLEHQAAVENKTGSQPRTMLPGHWVSKQALNRAEANTPRKIRESLPNLFRPSSDSVGR